MPIYRYEQNYEILVRIYCLNLHSQICSGLNVQVKVCVFNYATTVSVQAKKALKDAFIFYVTWYLIVSIPELCILTDFGYPKMMACNKQSSSP